MFTILLWRFLVTKTHSLQTQMHREDRMCFSTQRGVGHYMFSPIMSFWQKYFGAGIRYTIYHHLPVVIMGLFNPSIFINQPVGIWDIYGFHPFNKTVECTWLNNAGHHVCCWSLWPENQVWLVNHYTNNRIYIHTYIHYIALHYITLHYTTLHYTTLHYTTLHYSTLHYITLHYTTLHYTTLHYTTLQYITLHYITLHYTTLHYSTLHYITLHYIHTYIYYLYYMQV